MMALHYTDKEMEEQALLAFAGKRAILFSESGLDRIGCSVGDTITLTCPAGQYSYRRGQLQVKGHGGGGGNFFR